MSKWREISFLLITFALSVSSEHPRCQDEGVIFDEEPADVKVTYRTNKVVTFPCKYRGSSQRPQWIINSSSYSSLDSDLPHGHLYRNYSLVVTDIRATHNNTLYQCQVLSSNQGSICAYNSTVGKLIIKSKAFDVKCSSRYRFNSHKIPDSLIGISTKITQSHKEVSGLFILYNISYFNSVSGEICGSGILPSSSCEDTILERFCKHVFNVTSSTCPKTPAFNVTVKAIDLELDFNGVSYTYTSEPIKIEAVNNFVEVSFEKIPPRIHLNFTNHPKQGEIFYSVRYGPLTPSCAYLPSQTRGHLLNLNLLSLQLNIFENKTFCFVVVANYGGENKAVRVEGVYNIDSEDTIETNTFVTVTLVVIIAVVLCGICFCLTHRTYIKQDSFDLENDVVTEAYGELNEEYDCSDDKKFLTKDKQSPIDKSTTYYQLLRVTEDCLMYKFAVKHFPSYQPEEGFGYFKKSDNKLESIPPHKKLILMDNENVPKYAVVRSTMRELTIDSGAWTDIYQQNRSFPMTINSGGCFLYCALSKDVTTTAFWKEYNVTEDCEQSEFAEKKIPRYSSDWLRYCYFEFTKPEYIKPHQRIMVLKKDGSLFTGPGVRHIVGAVGDGTKIIPVPNFYEDWKHVFIQSRKVDRRLTRGSKFLFCAMMDRVRAHYSMYEIKRECKMADFGSYQIPGFKPERGLGYYEFTDEEYFKPHKKVILVHKSKKLYTGSGAQFFCTGGEYNEDTIMRKSKISPPDLTHTKWKHIFIQSHSKERELLPGTKFLYCEYKTYK